MPRYRVAVSRWYHDVTQHWVTADSEVQAGEVAMVEARLDPPTDFGDALTIQVIEREEEPE